MTPEISALLTTHNRADLLPQVLAGLAAQRIDPSRYEVVVIDDGSSDSTQAVLRRWQNRLPLRIHRQNQAGLAAAKNLGIFLARSPLLVFLDDDDVAEPDLLIHHLATHLANPDPAIAVLGLTTLAPHVLCHPLMQHVTQTGCQLFSYGWMQPGQVLDYTAFWGGRSSCKRSLLVKHGVFHPTFRFGCEDIELGWRLRPHGLRVIFEPRAHTVMIRALTFDQFCTRSYRQGRSQAQFAALHADPLVQTYCEIDEAVAAWARESGSYAAHLRWVRKLDRLAGSRAEAGMGAHPLLQETLEAGYRKAFFLSRSKGVVDGLRGASMTSVASEGPHSLFGVGLPATVRSNA